MQQVVLIKSKSRNLAYLGLAVNLLQSTLAPVEAAPVGAQFLELPPKRGSYVDTVIECLPSFNEVDRGPFVLPDYPNPRRKTGVIVAGIETIPSEDAVTSFNQTQIYQLPQPRKVGIVTTIRTIEIPGTPANTPQWRNPYRINPDIRNEFWVNNNLLDTLTPPSGAAAKIPLEWRNPDTKKRQTLTHTNNNSENTLAPVVAALPVRNDTLITPQRKRYIDSIIEIQIAEEPSLKPQLQIEYPNPLLKRKIALSWSQERKQFYADIKPHKQDNWPNPLRKGRIVQFHTQGKANEVVTEYAPFNTELGNPIIGRKNRVDWLQASPRFVLATTKPNGIQIYENPTRRLKPLPNTWIQPRPGYYIEPSLLILSTQIYDNPNTRKRILITKVSTRPSAVAGTQKPFNEATGWPNPVLRPKRAQDWKDYFVFDESEIPVNNRIDIPIRKRFFDASYIKSPQFLISGAASPISNVDYPNPRIVKQYTRVLINNLLQSTLEPAAGDIPFYENKWPNPLVGKRNFHEGWLQEVKKYYVEEPLQPNQYNWPVFRALRRADVGYIFTQKQEANPLFASITDVPLKKTPAGIVYVDNPIVTLSTPVIVEIPFNQLDWQNPRARVRITRDIIDWLDQYYPILPEVKGRVICLLADAIEYELEAGLEPYDLDAAIIIYDLDAGGNDCE